MGLLDRIRAWLGMGGDEAGDPDPDPADDAAGDEPRLDPSNVTEVRTEAADDPVEKLSELDDEGPDGEDATNKEESTEGDDG